MTYPQTASHVDYFRNRTILLQNRPVLSRPTVEFSFPNGHPTRTGLSRDIIIARFCIEPRVYYQGGGNQCCNCLCFLLLCIACKKKKKQQYLMAQRLFKGQFHKLSINFGSTSTSMRFLTLANQLFALGTSERPQEREKKDNNEAVVNAFFTLQVTIVIRNIPPGSFILMRQAAIFIHYHVQFYPGSRRSLPHRFCSNSQLHGTQCDKNVLSR